ncbi:MAG: lactonase family protein [Planctomycetes bacterium]|jgi:6-phosphogluconolactonase|nr:lactonase family protein [Planctomycetota bacterium]
MSHLIAMLCLNCLSAAQPADVLVYVGTYTSKGGSEGVYVYRLDPATGGLKHVSTAPRLNNPSFVAIDPKGRCVYAVREGGGPGGAIVALARNPATNELTILNEQPSGGQGPCYVTVDRAGQFVLAANYGSGSVALFPVAADGRLEPAGSVVQHEGSSVNPARQKGPHAHSIVLDPANRFAFAPDLGIDKIMIYRLDRENGKLVPNDPPFARCEPGSGPRHFTFHPDGKHAYVIEELSSTVTAFAYEAAAGTLKTLQKIRTLPQDFQGASTCAEVQVHPSGQFLYGSNRGHDSIAVFAIDSRTGTLRPLGHTPTQGKNPRNFAIDPSGTFLLAANQDGNTIVSFRINPDTGALTATGQVCEVSRPVCVKMVKP